MKNFKPYTLSEFNKAYQMNAPFEDLFIFTDYIESQGLNYFYASLSYDDVLEAVKDEQELADELGLDFIVIEEEVYIAVYES